AAAFKLNDFALSTDGQAVSTDTSGTMPTLTTLRLGNTTPNIEADGLNSPLRRLHIYKRKKPNQFIKLLSA
ncbi:MAG: hypothetical protein ACREU7_08790, partial [Burkholderiales bacterium]